MLRYAIAGMALLAATAGGAMAQAMEDAAPVVPGTSSTTHTERSTDIYGNQVERSQSSRTGVGGNVDTSRSDVRGADGSRQTTVRRQWTGPMLEPDTTTTTTRTVR